MTLVLSVLGILLLLLGRWGWRRGGSLVAHDRHDLDARREASVRRGSAAAFIAGLLLIVGGAVALVAT